MGFLGRIDACLNRTAKHALLAELTVAILYGAKRCLKYPTLEY